MTYNDIVRRLSAVGIEDCGHEAALLLEHFCGVSPETLVFRRNGAFESEELEAAIKKREMRYPLQYIIGEWWFCNERYEVGEGCLIPRSETEMLVNMASELLPSGASFLDLCTGSGCIAISTLCRRRDCTAVGADLSGVALGYAGRNAVNNGVAERLSLLPLDVLDPDAPDTVCGGKSFSAILSNPPYIKLSAREGLQPELSYEPDTALFADEDGMTFYRAIVDCFLPRLPSGGFALLEIGYDLGRSMTELCSRRGLNCQIIKDAAGLDRVAYIKI